MKKVFMNSEGSEATYTRIISYAKNAHKFLS